MNKTLLIIRREYLSRITKKTFILSTILTPLLFVGVIALSTYLSISNSEELHIGVYDETGIFASKLKGNEQLVYEPIEKSDYNDYLEGKNTEVYSGVLHIPAIDIEKPQGIQYISKKQLSIFSDAQVENDLNDVLINERMILANIDTVKLKAIYSHKIKVAQQVISEKGSDDTAASREASSGVSYLVGYFSGLMIYLLMFIYGSMVMRGVMEEKVNRIAEVMVSSVKPIQLMMGKIIGIGAVGLTQFLIWVVLLLIGSVALSSFAVNPDDVSKITETAMAANADVMKGANTSAVLAEINTIKQQLNIPLLVGMFVFYFITGYLFYAALFAAVGSAVNEDPQDAQAMMMPITIPIIFSIIIMTSAVANPTGPLAVWTSIIPFTSPIIMMARLPFGVPGTVQYWEFGLSIGCMVFGFLFTTWLSARIYRTGILLYGKKPNWMQMLRWVFKK